MRFQNNHQENESLSETSEEVTNDELRYIWLESCEKVTKSDEDLRTWINGKADIYCQEESLLADLNSHGFQ